MLLNTLLGFSDIFIFIKKKRRKLLSSFRGTNWGLFLISRNRQLGMLLFILPASFLCGHILFFCLSRLRGRGACKEVKEIPQRETENKQDGATSQKRSCAVRLWDRWLDYSLSSYCRHVVWSGQHDPNVVINCSIKYLNNLLCQVESVYL